MQTSKRDDSVLDLGFPTNVIVVDFFSWFVVVASAVGPLESGVFLLEHADAVVRRHDIRTEPRDLRPHLQNHLVLDPLFLTDTFLGWSCHDEKKAKKEKNTQVLVRNKRHQFSHTDSKRKRRTT